MALSALGATIDERQTRPFEDTPDVQGKPDQMTAKVKNKICLVILDGWGNSQEEDGNAIHAAETPVMEKLCSKNGMQIEAHGEHVGLPRGQMGNSEVGHLNLGSGRVVIQDIVRINKDIEENKLVENDTFKLLCERSKQTNGRLHLAGLVSDGGVHSHIDHLFALVRAAKELEVRELYLHFFGDGRDTSPTSGEGFVQQVADFFAKENYGKLSTIVGRYYAMDRDKRWERIRTAYDAMIAGDGEKCTDDKATETVKGRYSGIFSKETDEFLKPIVFGDEKRRIQEGDTILFFNFRADRMRQITEVFGLDALLCDSKHEHPKNIQVFGMTQYNPDQPFKSLFPALENKNTLAECLSSQGVPQFHCAETEKYAHVTYFFNGGNTQKHNGEEHCLVDSPKVKTYDQEPEMSSAGVADKVIEQIEAGKYPFIICNFAPSDMVGHTGDFKATVKACEAVDQAVGKILAACEKNKYVLLITADHGNAEQMKDPNGEVHTAHTTSTVPFICCCEKFPFKKDALMDRRPALCDVAPTILDIMGLPKPDEMTGVCLVENVPGNEKDFTTEQDVKKTVGCFQEFKAM